MSSIDINKYDRMMRCFGVEESKLIQSGTVSIIGLDNGYAGEICKNLALSGIKKINLIGKEVLSLETISTSMYYRNQNLGMKCSTILADATIELNGIVQVETFNYLKQVELKDSVLVVINRSIDDAISINKICRWNNCKMVYLMGSGLAGSIVVDCIEQTVMDPIGEIKESIQIKNITKDSIICSNDLNRGDMIKFTFIQGNNTHYLENNMFTVVSSNSNSIKIVSQDNTFILPDDFVFINGTIISITKPVTFLHKPFEELTFDNIAINLDKIFTDDNSVETKYLFTKTIHLEPVTSILAGFASTEIIKLIGLKYTPINQIYSWEDFSLFSSYESIEQVNNEYQLLCKKIKENNILIVGCGALGCEWLKQMAMLNCTNVDVVDPDHIEHSNLSRQFLFRPCHVKQPKCKVAINSILHINPTMNLASYEEYMGSKNPHFTEKIFKDKTIVINALDNIETRRYIDGICFDKQLPLFESGTMGMKANSQPIIPFITETYSMMNDSNDEKQYPVCTIKNFPNTIQHTIHWARDHFEKYNRGPANCNRYIENPDFLKKLSPIELNTAIEDINYFLHSIPKTWIDCLFLVKESFDLLFCHNIKQLLHCFPKDHTIDNIMFWSQGKICPEPLFFNPYNISNANVMVKYLYYTTNIMCQIYRLPIASLEDMIKYIQMNSLKFMPKDYTIDNKIKIAKDDSELKTTVTKTFDTIELKTIEKISFTLLPQVFDKDDDSSYHIEFITSCSNCRAINYSIPTVTEYETKGIVGKIIPAVATTTSTIVGLIAMEFLRYIITTPSKQCLYRSWFLNMADNTIVESMPMPAPMLKIGNKEINCWTKFNYNIDGKTMQDLIRYIQTTFEIIPYMILYQSSIVYSEGDDTDKSLYEMFKKEYSIDVKIHNVVLTIVDTTIENNLPPIILF